MVIGPDMRANSEMAVFASVVVARRLLARVRWPGQLSMIYVDDLALALVSVAEDERADGRTFIPAGNPVRLADLFEWTEPSAFRMPIGWAAGILRPFARRLPFQLKVLLYPALTASDAASRELAWRGEHGGPSNLAGVIGRERRRVNAALSTEGTTVVTGAASGLGRALAERLAQRGRRLLLVDSDGERLAATAQPGRASFTTWRIRNNSRH
jgi:nucleoside-diphosphate-sugar epimerase